MILGIGSDIIDIRRIEKLLAKQGAKFLARTFTAAEQKKSESRKATRASAYAKRFAAKEAMAKALGTGIGENAGLKDIEITNKKRRTGDRRFGRREKTLTALTPRGHRAALHVTLADEYPYALAFVMIVAEPKNKG